MQEVADKEKALMLHEMAMIMAAAGWAPATPEAAKQLTLLQWVEDIFPVRPCLLQLERALLLHACELCCGLIDNLILSVSGKVQLVPKAWVLFSAVLDAKLRAACLLSAFTFGMVMLFL